MVNIDMVAYEELVRDSEKLRVIESMAIAETSSSMSKKTILAVCGYTPEPEAPSVDKIDVKYPVNDAAQDPDVSPPTPERKKKRIDRGKVRALHDAGWSNVKIADEMGCSEASVSMILKENNN